MNLLLILSAMLSALTGAVAIGRVPEVRLHQSAGSVAMVSVAASKVAGRFVRHPEQALPDRRAIAGTSQVATIDPVRLVPIYMARRRE